MVTLYDTTLRDGTQREGMSLSVEDKLRIASKLDALGIHYVEGGFPGSNPKDVEFFERARDLKLEQAVISAFGMTCAKDTAAENDAGLAALLDTGCKALCIFGKSWDIHVTETLRATLEENVRMVHDSCAYLKAQGRTVFFDAEHFFDGYKANATYALEVVQAAERGGRRRDHPVRHQRRHAAARSHAHRRARSALALTDAAGHPRTQRRRLCRRQLARSRRGGLHAGAGHHERLRRARRQRRPDQHHPVARAQDGRRSALARTAQAADRGQPLRRRDRQHLAQPLPAVRGHERLRAQGRDPRERGRPAARGLRARRPGRRRQHGARRGQRACRAGVAHDEGRRARHRPVRRPGPGRPGARRHQGARVPRLLVRGCRRLARRSCCASASAPTSRPSGSSPSA